jgi:hypothetical protein
MHSRQCTQRDQFDNQYLELQEVTMRALPMTRRLRDVTVSHRMRSNCF